MTREESWADKLAHDMEYIADRSVALYLSVLLATVAKVLGRGPAAPSGRARRARPYGRLAAGTSGAARLPRMCGICGVAAPGAARTVEAVRRMSATPRPPRARQRRALPRRRPVALATRRLSIIDLEHGDQPIANEDGSVAVVQNGEIYNYRELRGELERRGPPLRDRTRDTEVLVHLYEEHGDGFVERLRGMFAFALWDARERRLLLARDRFGIKPLYYRARRRRRSPSPPS